MRKDMYKIICERPRHGRRIHDHHPYRKAKKVVLTEDFDCVDVFSGRTKLPIKPLGLSWDERKSFSDYLSPLFRFIEKQVGRPWDDVYSEICENITLDSTTRRHVRQHVDDHVEINVCFNEHGDPCYKRISNYRYGFVALTKGDLYKDPVDGVLKIITEEPKADRIRREERRSMNKGPVKRFFDKNENEFTPRWIWGCNDHNPDGVTFIYEPVGNGMCWFKTYSVMVEQVRTSVSIDDDGNHVYEKERYRVPKKVRATASKKDIKKYGLNS